MTTEITLDQALDIAMQLSSEQLDTLIDILRKRQIDKVRAQIAADARETMQLYEDGRLKAQSAEDLIADLYEFVDSD